MTTPSNPAADLRRLDTQLPTGRYLAEMWDRRDFVVAMPIEELRVSHQDTLLGNVWHLGNPLLTTLVYYFVFGVLLGVDRGIDNFITWLTIGVFTFGLTRGCVMGGSKSIATNRGLMRAIRFPRALLPVSVVISRLLTFGYQLAVIVLLVLATGEGISRRWVFLPLVMLVHTALNLGGAFTAARLNDSYRDVQEIIPFLFRLLIFFSGVMFPIQNRLAGRNVPALLRTLIALNPLTPMINMYRWVFLGTPMSIGGVAYAVLASGTLLAFGFWYFRGAELRYGRA